MTAEWVKAIARVLADDRRDLVAFVRAAPAGFWARDSGAPSWTNRHVLAHLAGGNDQLVQTLLRAAVRGEDVDPAVFGMDTDAENLRRVEERLRWSVEEMTAELERDGAEVQELLSRLADEDEGRRYEGLSVSLGAFLRIVERERHDHHHLIEMTKAESDA